MLLTHSNEPMLMSYSNVQHAGPTSPMQPARLAGPAGSAGPAQNSTEDLDEDELLQAVLLASLCPEEVGQEQQADLIQKQARLLKACTAPPLIGMPESLYAFGLELQSSMLQERLRALEDGPSHLKLCRVRGDGHCLFRAIAASLVLGAAWGGKAAFQAFQQHLGALQTQGLSTVGDVARSLSELLGHGSADVLGALRSMNEEDVAGCSSSVVCALRRCATAHMRGHAGRFNHSSCSGEDLETYCVRMEQVISTSPVFSPAYGGHSEIVALSESLLVRVEIIDCSSSRTDSSSVSKYLVGEGLPPASPTVYLLRKGLHYHLLLPAQVRISSFWILAPATTSQCARPAHTHDCEVSRSLSHCTTSSFYLNRPKVSYCLGWGVKSGHLKRWQCCKKAGCYAQT